MEQNNILAEILPKSWFSCDVTAAMLVNRTIVKKVFAEFDSIIMQSVSDILPLFCMLRYDNLYCTIVIVRFGLHEAISVSIFVSPRLFCC